MVMGESAGDSAIALIPFYFGLSPSRGGRYLLFSYAYIGDGTHPPYARVSYIIACIVEVQCIGWNTTFFAIF